MFAQSARVGGSQPYHPIIHPSKFSAGR